MSQGSFADVLNQSAPKSYYPPNYHSSGKLLDALDIGKLKNAMKHRPDGDDGVDTSFIPSVDELRDNQSITNKELLLYIEKYQQKVEFFRKKHRNSTFDLHNKMFRTLQAHEEQQKHDLKVHDMRIKTLEQELARLRSQSTTTSSSPSSTNSNSTNSSTKSSAAKPKVNKVKSDRTNTSSLSNGTRPHKNGKVKPVKTVKSAKPNKSSKSPKSPKSVPESSTKSKSMSKSNSSSSLQSESGSTTSCSSDCSESTKKQISKMMQFQARLLQRVKEQKEHIEDLERQKESQKAQIDQQTVNLQTLRAEYAKHPNPKYKVMVSIDSPLEFLYFVYGPSNCKPFPSINKISTEKQAELIRPYLSSTSTLNALDVVKPFVEAGMKELDTYHRASSFYCILFNFVKDNELFHSNDSVNKLTQWNEFHISRSLFLPMEQFMILFGTKRDYASSSLFVFIYELSQWIIENEYNFKRFRTDWNRFHGVIEEEDADGDEGDGDKSDGDESEDDDSSDAEERVRKAERRRRTAGKSKREKSETSSNGAASSGSKKEKAGNVKAETKGKRDNEVDDERFAKHMVSLVYPKRFGKESTEQIDEKWIHFLNLWTPNCVLKRMEEFQNGHRGSYEY